MKKILLLLLFVLLVSCKAEDDGILSVAVAQEPPTLDVMVNASVSGRNILVGNVYEGYSLLMVLPLSLALQKAMSLQMMAIR